MTRTKKPRIQKLSTLNLRELIETQMAVTGGDAIRVRAVVDAVLNERLPPPEDEAVPAVLDCPKCDARHVDLGEWQHRLHHTHRCQPCGHEWRVDRYCYGVLSGAPDLRTREVIVIALVAITQRSPILRERCESVALQFGCDDLFRREYKPLARPMKPQAAIVVRGTQVLLREGETRHVLYQGLTLHELRTIPQRLARRLAVRIELE